MSFASVRFAVLTVSDRCWAGLTRDTSGPGLAEQLTASGAHCIAHACVPDERPIIAAQLRRWATMDRPPALVLTTGGTGLATRDVTPEATLDVLERRADGLLELARFRCLEHTPRTYLSRGVAGTTGRTLILNLPGSRTGSGQMLAAMLDILPHALATLADAVPDHGSEARQTPQGLAPLATPPGDG